ncbi:MAG: DUF1361 domain-containing protein [Micrococcales bacterium]|nr:DUF1361 domain-containing protein [Micrococcales bacterium]
MTFHIDRRLVVLALACVVVTVGCLVVYAVTERWLFLSFVWNLFLAVLPLVASTVVDVHGRVRPWVGWVACAVWLPLFPNTVYVTTDIIHLHRVRFGGDTVTWPFHRYTDDIVAWSQLFVLAALVVLTLYLGLWSLSHVHTFLTARWGQAWALVAVVGVALACGYGIYLGRFVRLNSWEVLRPDTLVPLLVSSANEFTVTFTGLVAAYVLLTYALFWAFADRSPVRLGACPPASLSAPEVDRLPDEAAVSGS